MKSNYIRNGGAESRQMLRDIAKEEIRKQKAEFCPKCEEQSDEVWVEWLREKMGIVLVPPKRE